MWQMAAAQAAFNLYQGFEASEAAGDASRASASAYRLNAMEELDRLKKAQELNMQNIKAAGASSGLLNTGSVDRYRNRVESDQRAAYDWERSAIDANYNAIKRGGQMQASALRNQSYAQAVQIGAAGFSDYWASRDTGGGV